MSARPDFAHLDSQSQGRVSGVTYILYHGNHQGEPEINSNKFLPLAGSEGLGEYRRGSHNGPLI